MRSTSGLSKRGDALFHGLEMDFLARIRSRPEPSRARRRACAATAAFSFALREADCFSQHRMVRGEIRPPIFPLLSCSQMMDGASGTLTGTVVQAPVTSCRDMVLLDPTRAPGRRLPQLGRAIHFRMPKGSSVLSQLIIDVSNPAVYAGLCLTIQRSRWP